MQLFDRLNQIMLSYCFKQWNQVTFPLMFYYCKGVFFKVLKQKCQFLIFCVSFLNVIIWIFSILHLLYSWRHFSIVFHKRHPGLPRCNSAIVQTWATVLIPKAFTTLGFLPFPTPWLSIKRLNCPLTSCAKMLASDRTLSTPRTGKS